MKRFQSGQSGWLRSLAVVCLLLMLAAFVAEATHVHANTGQAGSSAAPCVICISAHSNAPALIFHSLLVLFAVAMVVVCFQDDRKSIARVSRLFIRPPPAV